MNELDITNTQSLILLLVIGLLFLYLKRIENHKRDLLKQTIETPSKDLNPCYGRYIQLGMTSKGGLNMFSLSKESEYELAHGVLNIVESYLGARDLMKPRLTGLMSAQEAMDELDIKYKTLQRWESAGLRRYQPPLEDTRKVYYKVTDLLKFLGVENG